MNGCYFLLISGISTSVCELVKTPFVDLPIRTQCTQSSVHNEISNNQVLKMKAAILISLLFLLVVETAGKRCKGRFPVGPSCRAVSDYKTGKWQIDASNIDLGKLTNFCWLMQKKKKLPLATENKYQTSRK